MTVSEIESAIEKLQPREISELSEWFLKFKNRV